MQYGYHQIGHRVPRYLAEEFGIDPMSPTAAEDYIRLAKLEPVPVPTKQQASYPGDVITWYVDPKRTQAFKLSSQRGHRINCSREKIEKFQYMSLIY